VHPLGPLSFLLRELRLNTDMIASQTEARTPVSNTGLIPQVSFKVHIDTLTYVLRSVPTAGAAVEVKDLLERAFQESIEFDVHCKVFMMKQWDGCSRKSLRGTKLHWLAPKDGQAGQLRIHLTGAAIAAGGQKQLRDCFQVLREVYKGEATRIDVAVDDSLKLTKMSDVHEAQRNRNYTGVRSHRYINSGGLEAADGVTCYFGSSASDLQLRIYDKFVESKGKIDVIRWELQLRRYKARTLCDVWLGDGQESQQQLAAKLSGAVAGAVDFIDRSNKAKDLSRCERLPWWQKVRCYFAAPSKIGSPEKKPLMDKTIGWLSSAAMPSLAMVKRYLGDAAFWQYISEEMEEKEPLLSPQKEAIIAHAKHIDISRLALSNAARKIREYFEPIQLRVLPDST